MTDYVVKDLYLICTKYNKRQKIVIESFVCKETQKIWNGNRSLKLPESIQDKALRKLRQLDAAQTLEDLRNPPGNRLEALKGDRKGKYSIRINQQWRICFVWSQGNAKKVEIVDYHT
jgi:proteic killer suppression protein